MSQGVGGGSRFLAGHGKGFGGGGGGGGRGGSVPSHGLGGHSRTGSAVSTGGGGGGEKSGPGVRGGGERIDGALIEDEDGGYAMEMTSQQQHEEEYDQGSGGVP